MNSPQKETIKAGSTKTITSLPHIYAIILMGLFTFVFLSVEYMFQVFLTIGGVTKFIPSTGVTLPLVSYGGSSIVTTFLLFSIIQGLYIIKRNDEEEMEEMEAQEE